MEAVVRYHLHRLITGPNDVRTDGRNNVTFLACVDKLMLMLTMSFGNVKISAIRLPSE